MAEKKFKSHMMYKKCKGVMVKTMEQHLKLKKKGYDEKLDKACKTKGAANAMKGGPGGKGALDSSRMRGDIPEKPKPSGGGLTDKQKTLPPFLQEKILKAKQKRASKKEERQEKKAAKKESKKK